MEKKSARLYFIDAMRAWAILMMLQGHFVDGLLDMGFRDNSVEGYTIWKYFRGITAPVFFTVSGFIFTYLLVRAPQKGFDNPRIKKGVRRGLQLLLIGYLLRVNLFGLLQGEIYDSFYLVDVLHCIGLSILGIIGLYLLMQNRKKWLFPMVLASITFLLFLLEPLYKAFSYSFLPDALSNYFTKTNGSVFTIFPWFGYAAFGGFLSLLFTRFKDFKYLYPVAIGTAMVFGISLIFYSSDLFLLISRFTGIQLFADIYFNNYLFIRLGDVFLVFAVFMLFRSFLTHNTLIKIGQSTLSIYVIHFIILYGSFTGLGLYRFFHHSLTPQVVIPSALIFMVICTYTALLYERHKATLKSNLLLATGYVRTKVEPSYLNASKIVRVSLGRLLRLFGLVKN
ncbi:heparan-alpha-glucosaminide N-acetyltransferase domain-containing protein [Ulvibacterium marinum]|uniref:heparan-alpha-glucosaminide N-acetyltransferase domain-containing protein n=1 Tax=Ulvibacterium marinum TaxID=2419782 RepID=UPI0024952487|nr:heparan-alpha-glucosaminide N-acetyltransferase domain-containing protein [Ulvibacterium marinum]